MSDPRSPPKNPAHVKALRELREAMENLPTEEEWRIAKARAAQPPKRKPSRRGARGR